MNMTPCRNTRLDSSRIDNETARRRFGVIVVLIALLLPAILAMAAFSVDVTYMQLSRAQLRAATDAAARAGGEALSRLQDLAAAHQAAKSGAAANNVGGKPLQLADDDIIFGRSARTAKGGPWVFDPGGDPINSVRVRGRRTGGSPSGPVKLFFGRAIGTPNFEPVKFATVVKLDRDICLVVDRSGSMKVDVNDESPAPNSTTYCQPPGPNSRWTALSAAVDSFIAGVEETPAREKLGLVSYSNDNVSCGITNYKSTRDCELSDSSSGVAGAMDAISTRAFNGMTNISAGISSGIQVLTNGSTARPFAEKVMVLFTDGRFNEGPHPVDLAKAAASQKITIHTVTFGVGANQTDMQAVAAATGGDHYHAPSASALRDIFYEIGASMPTVLTE